MTKSFVPYAASRKLAIVEVAAQPLAPADCSLGGFAAAVAAAELSAVGRREKQSGKLPRIVKNVRCGC